MRNWLSIAVAYAALTLSACATPQTVGPVASDAEIQQEEEVQAAYLQGMRAKGLVLGGENRKSPRTRLEKAAAKVAPAAVEMCRAMGRAIPENCAYTIHYKHAPDDAPNAWADGEQVYVTNSLIRYAKTDDELAFVLAHEFGHNIMEHRSSHMRNAVLGMMAGAALDAAAASQTGYSGNTYTDFGAAASQLAFSPGFEREADYVGLYIIARAGYDYKKAPEFWRTLSLVDPSAIYFQTTHPTNAERYVVMKKTIEEIDTKTAQDIALLPEMKTQTTALAHGSVSPSKQR